MEKQFKIEAYYKSMPMGTFGLNTFAEVLSKEELVNLEIHKTGLGFQYIQNCFNASPDLAYTFTEQEADIVIDKLQSNDDFLEMLSFGHPKNPNFELRQILKEKLANDIENVSVVKKEDINFHTHIQRAKHHWSYIFSTYGMDKRFLDFVTSEERDLNLFDSKIDITITGLNQLGMDRFSSTFGDKFKYSLHKYSKEISI